MPQKTSSYWFISVLVKLFFIENQDEKDTGLLEL